MCGVSAMDTQSADSIGSVLSTFRSFQTTLSNIYEDTVSNEVDLEGKSKLYLDEKHLHDVLRSKVTFVVLGQQYAAQCKFLNWLVQKEVLPVCNNMWLRKESSLTVKYNSKQHLTFKPHYGNKRVLPVNDKTTSTLGLSRYLMDYAALYAPQDNSKKHVLFNGLNFEDIEDAELEVHLDAEILQSNAQIFLRSAAEETTRSYCSNEISQNILPVYVYTLTSYALSSEDVKSLKRLKVLEGNCAVLFWVDGDLLKCNNSVQYEPSMNSKSEKGQVSKSSEVTHQVKDICSCNNDTLKASSSECTICSAKSCDSKSTERDKTVSNHCLDCYNPADSAPLCSQQAFNCQSLKDCLEDLDFQFLSLHELEVVDFIQTNKDLQIFNPHVRPSSVLVTHAGADQLSLTSTVSFVRAVTLRHISKAAETLNKYHEWMLDGMIYLAFSLSRNVMVTPKKMSYAYEAEKQLFKKLLEIASYKQPEIARIIAHLKLDLKDNILQAAEDLDTSELESDATDDQATVLIQNMVLKRIKDSAAKKLACTIDILRETMIGTLTRCIKTLEVSPSDEDANDPTTDASAHFRMILNAAYYVEVSIQSSSSLLKLVIDRLRKMLHTFTWKGAPARDPAWKRMVAEDVLNNICENKLAKTMCSQFQLQLRKSHEAFLTAMNRIEERQKDLIKRDQKEIHTASKVVAPKVAQLVLRSRSVLDEVLYGAPKMNKEIGRGSYGVVFACSNWPMPLAEGKKCAVKSVVPPDQKHLNDLALEFYYSIKLPPHPRIVQLFGSVVDYSYGEGMGSPAVLLVMERMLYDLHRGLERKMRENDRLRVALEVVEGIRYLHSQGLVHRDIKLRNILLDANHHAKISDLGFCKPTAMISGSIVGTPVHMPPELFSGQYDSSVDVYAFGILFWHLCAGTTQLPKSYKQWTTKDHLWNAVKQGVRPEYRSSFREDCWKLMQDCWEATPSKRPIPGILFGRLKDIVKDFTENVLKIPST